MSDEIKLPHRDDARDNKTCLSYWFPLIEAAGIPVPKTRIIKMDRDEHRTMFCHLIDCKAGPCPELAKLVGQIRDAAFDIVGASQPFFLRTGMTSNKHDWQRSCRVNDWKVLPDHIYNLIEFSECCDMLGLPSDVWVVREMLKTTPMFHAFHGQMPIIREFRYFVEDGRILHRQPYWPAHAVERHNPSRPDWREVLEKASIEAPLKLDDLVLKVSAAVPGHWSVDLLETSDQGWFVTDMAEGSRSYKWTPGEENK